MVALPAWVQEGGIEAMLERLADRATRTRLDAEWFSKPTPYPLDTTIAMAADLGWRGAEGLKVTEAADRAGLSPGDFVCEISRACGMAVGIFGFRAGERSDIRTFLIML